MNVSNEMRYRVIEHRMKREVLDDQVSDEERYRTNREAQDDQVSDRVRH